AIANRVLELTDYLCEGAERAGLEVYSSRRPGDQSGIVSLLPAGEDVRELVRRCRAEGIVVNHRAGRIRVSPHCYNTHEEIDRLVVGVGINPDKAPFFTLEERVQLLQQLMAPFPTVEVRPFTGLAVRFVREAGARVMLRGLRTTSDMEYEFTMSLTNLALDPE